jgi:hypothetical protein
MKNLIKVLLIILLMLIIYFFIKNSQKDNYFKSISLSTSNSITNIANKQFMDTIVSVGLNVLDVKNCYITIKPMDDNIRNRFLSQNGLNLQACVIGTSDLYDIYIEDINKDDAITVLSHELIHLKQYNSGDLDVIGDGIVLWKGQKINVMDITYEQRPWEKEAFDNQGDVSVKIKKILY